MSDANDEQPERRSSFNKAADAFIENLGHESARHVEEAASRWATIESVRVVQKDVSALRKTIEGSIEGVKRIPGVVDIVAQQSEKMDNLNKVLMGIGIALAINAAMLVLQTFGVIKAHP